MNKIPVYSLDHYNKAVIKSIMEKYHMAEMEAVRLFLTSETFKSTNPSFGCPYKIVVSGFAMMMQGRTARSSSPATSIT